MAVVAADQPRQGLRLLQVVIDPLHQAVLKGEPSPSLLIVVSAGVQHLPQGVAVGDGHQLPPHLVAGGVERQGQGDLQPLLRQPVYLGHQPAGGNGDVSLAYVQSLRRAQKPYEAHHILIIVHGLPGTHDHHVGHALPRVPLDSVDLLQDLRGPQIPRQPVQSGGAEAAAHAAARLGGDAHRVAVLIAHEHALDHVAVLQAEQVLPGAVHPGDPHVHRLQRRPYVIRRQLLPEALRQIGHLVKIRRQLLVHPLVQLLCPERLLTGGGDLRRQLLQGHGFQIFFFHTLCSLPHSALLRNTAMKKPSQGYFPGRIWIQPSLMESSRTVSPRPPSMFTGSKGKCSPNQAALS